VRAATQSAKKRAAFFKKTAYFFEKAAESRGDIPLFFAAGSIYRNLTRSAFLVTYKSQATAILTLLKFSRGELYSRFIGKLLAGFNFITFYETELFRKSRLTSTTAARALSTGASPSAYVLDIIKTFFLFLINSRVLLFVNFELYVRLTFWERVCLLGIKHRLRFFRNSFSTIFFLNEFVDLAYLAFRNKNLDILLPYINRILKTLVI
jgi:hypothetical protein